MRRAVYVCGMLIAMTAHLVAASLQFEHPPEPLVRSLTDGQLAPVASVLVRQSLISKITEHSTKFLEKIATTTPIPAVTGDHYSFNSFNLSSFTLNSVDVVLEEPATIRAHFTNVSLSVPTTPFYIFQSIFGHKFGCHGSFSAVVANCNLTLSIGVGRSRVNGSLMPENVAVSAVYGTLKPSYKFNSDLCSIASKVISFFLGGLDKFLRKEVESLLPAKMARIITREGIEIFGGLPLRLAAAPNVTDGALQLTVSLLPTNSTPPTVVPPAFNDVLPHRDAEAYVEGASLNTFLAALTQKGDFTQTIHLPKGFTTLAVKKYMPKLYDACPACELGLGLAPLTPPLVLANNQSFQFSWTALSVSLLGFNSSLPPAGYDLFDASVNMELDVRNVSVWGTNMSTVDFQLDLPTLTATVTSSKIGTIDVSLVADLFHFLIQDVLFKGFDKNFAGITLPQVDGFSVYDLAILLEGGQLGLATNANIPMLSEERAFE